MGSSCKYTSLKLPPLCQAHDGPLSSLQVASRWWKLGSGDLSLSLPASTGRRLLPSENAHAVFCWLRKWCGGWLLRRWRNWWCWSGWRGDRVHDFTWWGWWWHGIMMIYKHLNFTSVYVMESAATSPTKITSRWPFWCLACDVLIYQFDVPKPVQKRLPSFNIISIPPGLYKSAFPAVAPSADEMLFDPSSFRHLIENSASEQYQQLFHSILVVYSENRKGHLS